MITEDKRHNIGHITTGMKEDILPQNTTYERECKNCSELAFCGGRCFNLSFQNDERFEIFCQRTKILISKLRAIEPDVKDLIERGVIREEDIHIQTTLTEQIP